MLAAIIPSNTGIIADVTGSYSIGLVMGPIERVDEEQQSTATTYKKQGKEDGIKAV